MTRARIGWAIVIVITFATPLVAIADTWNEPISKADKRFTVLASYNNAAVLDAETGLVWEQSPSTAMFDSLAAHGHCVTATVGNRKGWRLPTIQELASLVDPTQSSPALPAGHPFSNVGPSAVYWSATISASFGPPWSVAFLDGSVITGAGTGTGATVVWCVRGGQGVNPQ